MLFLNVNFSSFQKPSRYINNELNSSKKSFSVRTISDEVSVALCFPDIYEVGMSHLGLKILYDIVNRMPFAHAERVFAPWIDLEEYMKKNSVLLSSLESKSPLNSFDIAGFSLQYELSYTTVLNMLSLGGIPVRSEERYNSKKQFPIVMAGGPCTVNPAPMSAFIDAFLIGDGEEAITEAIEIVRQWKISGDGRVMSALHEISNLNGFYVPAVHDKSSSVIKRRFIKNLNDAPYPTNPVVPYASVVHDRINIEVARGCTMGCRFCQAGMIYRPLRERSPEKILSIAKSSLNNTGHDEVSFTSLSAGDYSQLLPLMKEFNCRFTKSKVSLSLPSLRVASVNQDILKEVKSIRKPGFTIAPEAATDRLRKVINKDFCEDDYERVLKALFKEGWLSMKLYFMIGLPSELDEDVAAIKDMAMKALIIAKKNTGRFVNIGITISPFVPKTHTPFQWCGQIPLSEIIRKQQHLKAVLSNKKLTYKGHDAEMSFLEAVFARGDKSLSVLIENAWKSGCRLDGWSELFDFSKWLDVMHATSIDGASYAEKTYEKDEQMPWDNIDVGIKREYLYKEYEKALKEEKTQDCKKLCAACGLACKEIIIEKHSHTGTDDIKEVSADAANNSAVESPGHKIRVRVQFSKTGHLRYLSHLELVTAILRSLRRSGVPLDYSKGFHPAPLVSFGPPLSVGIAGEREYFDMEVFMPFDIEFYINELNNTLPEGIKIIKMAIIPKNELSLNRFIGRYEYIVKISEKEPAVMNSSPVLVKRDGKEIDISSCIEYINTGAIISGAPLPVTCYHIMLKDNDNLKVRIGEIMNAVFKMNVEELDITRTGLYGLKPGAPNSWEKPL